MNKKHCPYCGEPKIQKSGEFYCCYCRHLDERLLGWAKTEEDAVYRWNKIISLIETFLKDIE